MAGCRISLSVSTSTYTTYMSASVNLYMYSNGKSYNSNNNVAWTISATGNSSRSGYHPYTKSTSAQWLGSASFSWSRASSSASKSISASYATRTNQGTLTTSTSVTVPALPYYNIVYNPSGQSYDTGSSVTKSVQYGSSYTIASPSYSIKNYEFQYWLEGSTKVPVGTKITVTGAHTYTAVWKLLVTTFTIGSKTATQVFTTEADSNLLALMKEYCTQYSIADTNFKGLCISTTKELITDAKGNLVESSLYTKSSGKWMYKGSAEKITLEYSYVYKDHNIYIYYLSTDKVIATESYTGIAGTNFSLNISKSSMVTGYKFAKYFKKVSKIPKSVDEFIKIDMNTTETDLKNSGYVNTATMESVDTYYLAVYTNVNTFITTYLYGDATRTTSELASEFLSTTKIADYITADGTFNSSIAQEEGTYICGYARYHSPYNSDDVLNGFDGKPLESLKGIVNNITVKINEEVLTKFGTELFITFDAEDIILKYKFANVYPVNEFFYLEYKTADAVNDLNYPIENFTTSIFISSNNVVLDINQSKSVLAIGAPAPDDVDEELVIFNRPITFMNSGAEYRQFIITYNMSLVNATPGQYYVTAKSCVLYGKQASDKVTVYQGDVISILKHGNAISVKINRYNKLIVYRNIYV